MAIAWKVFCAITKIVANICVIITTINEILVLFKGV